MCKRLYNTEDWCGSIMEVPMRTLSVLGLMFAHGALGVK